MTTCVVPECEKQDKIVRGLCNAHYLKQRRYGDPLHVARPPAPAGMKKCCRCQGVLPLDDFNKMTAAKDGHHPSCRACTKADKREVWAANREENRARQRALYPGARQAAMRAAAIVRWANRDPADAIQRQRIGHLRRKFGMTVEQYLHLHDQQFGLCASCGHPEVDIDKRTDRLRLLAVDHCHETGQIRGLLCRRCNTALGLLGDNAEGVRRLLDYLK